MNECNCNTFTFIKSRFIAPSVQNTKMENVRLFWKKIQNISCSCWLFDKNMV